MNSRFVLKQSSETVKTNLTVPSGSADIRLVAETTENRPQKRRGFRKVAKPSNNDSGARPARRIKLNRSIFNAESTAKPSFRVKTLNEIKNEKEANEDQVKTTAEASVTENVVTVISNSSLASESSPSPMPSVTVNISQSPVRWESANPIPARSVPLTSSPVSKVVGNASPARSVNTSPLSDTRTVINTRSLLQPSIKLTHVSQYKYKREFSNRNTCATRTVINRDALNSCNKESPTRTVPEEVSAPPPQSSPVKKRKVSPMRLILPKAQVQPASPSKKRKISPIRSPDSASLAPRAECTPALPLTSPPQPPSPLDSPPSPALSLGAQSDDDLEDEINTPVSNSRMILTSSPSKSTKPQKQKPAQTLCKTNGQKQAVRSQNTTKHDVHSRLGPPRNMQATHNPGNGTTENALTDDTLDVMSIIADDDELFQESKGTGLLKRSLSQDSIFSMVDDTNSRGNIRSLAKKAQTSRKHSIGDLITNKPLTRSFRIPKQTPNPSSTHRRNNVFHGSHPPPKPTRMVSKEGQPLNGFPVQDKVHSIRRNLGAKNIHKAWRMIKELDESNSIIDFRMLEEAVKVCELVSVKESSQKLADIAMGVFEMLKHRNILKPEAFMFTVMTLCRCGKLQEAFDKISEMVEARRFPPPPPLVHFANDLLKCLRGDPKWIFELLPYIKRFNFPNPTIIYNNCLSSLALVPVNMLKEITPDQWDALITVLCVPTNVQGTIQVQNIMDKHSIPISNQSITKLLILYRDTKCIKQLLDLAHSKCTSETFDIGAILADENLDIHDVEAHIMDLIKNGSLPQEDVLHSFIEKASSTKEFARIYNLFLKCEGSMVSLSTVTLKKMVDILENWDENITASVEVYAALRQAKIPNKKDARATPPLLQKRVNRFPFGRCHSFETTGWCKFGARCRFSHAVDERPQHFRHRSDSSSPQNVGAARRPDTSEGKQANYNAKINRDFPTTSATTTMVNGPGVKQFPSFQRPSFVVPMFNPILNHTPPLRVPPSAVRHPPAMDSRHPQCQPRSSNTGPRFAPFQPRVNKPTMFQPVPKATTPDQVKLNRSFSWEPSNNPKPLLRQSPLPAHQQPSPPSSNDGNNNKVSSEFQQRVSRDVAAKNWSDVYLDYIESKQANEKTIQDGDLRVFRNAFVKDVSVIGSNFSAFVDFAQEKKSSLKCSNSDPGNNSSFDQYDFEFFGSLGVSLMEKCLVTKAFDKGYEILHTLHAHNISYFDCGKNFGAYIRDIPPSAVAIIAVKLCMGMSQDDGLLGAVEVLRASNYAMPEDSSTPDNMEYRVKVLQQVFAQLCEKANISEAYEILQNLNASPHTMVPLYVKILNHYSSAADFDQSFDVLTEMNERGFDINIPPCQSLYEKFLKLCLTNEQNCEAITALQEMEARGITLNVNVWQEILNQQPSLTSEILASMLFQRCLNLGAYPATFFTDAPWLCQIGCGYSQLEMKFLMIEHLKQLREYLLKGEHTELSIDAIRDFQITLLPRVSGTKQTFNGSIQAAISKNSAIIKKVLEEDLNPPLMIADHTQEQFHSKFIVDSVSLYRWFSSIDDDTDDGDDALSNTSLETCVSVMTRMTDFN